MNVGVVVVCDWLMAGGMMSSGIDSTFGSSFSLQKSSDFLLWQALYQSNVANLSIVSSWSNKPKFLSSKSLR